MLRVVSRGFVLRKINRIFAGVDSLGLSARSVGTMRLTERTYNSFLFIGFCLVMLALAVCAMIANGHNPLAVTGVLSLAIPAPATTRKSGTPAAKPGKIREMEANLKQLARELEEGQTEMAAGPISQERGEELEQKAKEMTELQEHIDRYNEIAGIVSKSKQVGQVALPGEREDVQRKQVRTTLGHLFAMSDAYRQYKANGKSGWSAPVEVKGKFGRQVRLFGEEAVAFERKAYDPTTLPTLGADSIIAIDRDPELVRFEEPEILTMRDVLNVVPTTSDTIRYVKHVATTRGAATVARGALKPFLKVEFQATNVSTETIAVLSKVTEQDIDDAPRLVGIINGEMTLDVRVEEERQIVWGSGVSELSGLFDTDNDLPEFDRAEAGDTLIDTIRRMRTDLRKRRITPTFVAIDPIDWETIELAKGSTEQYIWGLVTDLRGPRIWSLRVVESDAMTNLETGERRVLMGDGTRGATLYTRSDIQMAVGLMDDDFGRNLRTLRAEERLALAVKRNFAFEYAVTEEASS